MVAFMTALVMEVSLEDLALLSNSNNKQVLVGSNSNSSKLALVVLLFMTILATVTEVLLAEVLVLPDLQQHNSNSSKVD